MHPITIDYETFYDSAHGYTLAKMSTEAYCRDPRFYAQLLCIKNRDMATDTIHADHLNPLEPWPAFQADGVVFIMHNARFDLSCMSRSGVHPLNVACTQSMARATGVARICRENLKHLAEFFGVPPKGDYNASMDGRRVESLSADELAQYVTYCKRDVEITAAIYEKMLPEMPIDGMEFIQLTLKMYTEPCLVLNKEVLTGYLVKLAEEKANDRKRLSRLFNLGSDEEFVKAIRSRIHFPKMLESLGATVPMKESAARVKSVRESEAALTDLLHEPHPDKKLVAKHVKNIRDGVMTPALAKSDEDFIALMEGEDEDVALLCQIRADNNSSIKESRAKRFLDAAARGPLCVALQAYSARTGRYTAGNNIEEVADSDRQNIQNLAKRSGDLTLRRAIEVPNDAHVLVASDSSQIEARTLAWLAGQADLLQMFRDKVDPYCKLAETIYGPPALEIEHKAKVEKSPEHKKMRDVGKFYQLSAGYRIGSTASAKRLRALRVWLGEHGDIEKHYAENKRNLLIYRASVPNIVKFWHLLDSILDRMITAIMNGEQYKGAFGGPTGDCVLFDTHHSVFGRSVPGFRLPNKFWILLPELRYSRNEEGRQERCYTHYRGGRGVTVKIHGGSLTGLINQGLAFAILATQGVRIDYALRHYAAGRLVMNVHDEWLACVLKAHEAYTIDTMNYCMTEVPRWLPGGESLPLECETGVGVNYADIK